MLFGGRLGDSKQTGESEQTAEQTNHNTPPVDDATTIYHTANIPDATTIYDETTSLPVHHAV